VDDGGAAGGEVVVAFELAEDRLGGGDDCVDGGEAGARLLAVAVPAARCLGAVDGAPPGEDAGVGDDEFRGAEADGAVRVGAEVDEVGALLLLERQQPAAGGGDVLPGILHPLQPVAALVHPPGQQPALLAPQPRPHRRHHHLVPLRLQRRRQLGRVGEDAADRVGADQDLHRPASA
jgi:hypothetical protein